MTISRRDFHKLIAGAGSAAAIAQLGRAASVAGTISSYRAMVGIYLYGGADGWNMIVPTDARYAAYAAIRGPTLAISQQSLRPMNGVPFGLHPKLAPLEKVWDDGGMGVVLNTGSLVQPLNKALFDQRPDLRPLSLMSHADEQAHWQGMRMTLPSSDGFMGRIADRMPQTPTPALIAVGESDLCLIGANAQPLVLPEQSSLERIGATWGSAKTSKLRQAALDSFAAGEAGAMTRLTAAGIASGYDQAAAADALLAAPGSAVDAYFRDPATGQPLTSDIALQLLRVAKMIEARDKLGHSKQVFFVAQNGHDTHVNQVTNPVTGDGRQGDLLIDLGNAVAAFYNAMKALGLSQNVTAFTMSDFGRVYQGNDQGGSDHAWGNNHLVVGGALAARKVHGRYPDQVLGGPEDARGDGRWIPSISIEEYIGSIARWHGVAEADMPYVFPNWATWSGGGRGPVPLFA